MIKLKNILIYDGSYFLHRSLKQPNLWDLRNSNLERTGGIYGFLNIFKKELNIFGNYFPIICWDNGQSDRRLEIYDNYKKHKEKIDDPDRKEFAEMTEEELDEDYVYNYKIQRKKVIELMRSFGIPNLIFYHTEGDDLMYWLSKHCNKSIVFTDDGDLLQLLSDNCKVRRPMHDTTITLNQFLSNNNYSSIYDFIKQKAICGDASDNIPGACYQIGEKTCQDFLKLYENLKATNNLGILYNEDKKILKDYCKNNNFKYRSAYFNFDEAKYKKNLELVDLNKIQDYEINPDKIYEEIKNNYKKTDIKKTFDLLNKYEIKTINVNSIFETIIMSRHNIIDK